MKIIIGLGNPGKQYEHTRHNAGFFILDTMFNEFEEARKFQAHIAKSGNHILGVKPQTFMNRSGESITKIVQYYKLNPKSDILVISDDIDMEFGKIRFRSSGNHGGQNGLRNIIEQLGSNEFARIKIGIGRNSLYTVSDWVLSKFQDTEIQMLQKEVFPKVEALIHEWLQKDS